MHPHFLTGQFEANEILRVLGNASPDSHFRLKVASDITETKWLNVTAQELRLIVAYLSDKGNHNV